MLTEGLKILWEYRESMKKCPATYSVSGSSYLQLLPEGRRIRSEGSTTEKQFRNAMEDAKPFLVGGKRYLSLDDSLINDINERGG